MGINNGVVDLICACISLLLFISLLASPQRLRLRGSNIVLTVIAFVFVMLVCDGAALLFLTENETLFGITETVSIMASYAAEWFFAMYLTVLLALPFALKRLVLWGMGAVCGIPVILYAVNFAYPFLYDLAQMQYISDVGYWVLQVLNLACIVAAILLLMLKGDNIALRDRILLSATLFLPVTSFVWDSLVPGFQSRYPLVFIVLLVNYIRFILSVSESAQKKINQLEEKRIKATLERIKPHYIYNVLTSIYYLCDADTEVAKEAISLFSDYLRGIFDLMQEQTTIPFARELQTVKNYVELEQMRFGDSIRVWYDIDADKFDIPPFTVQPLVENSVRHGAEQSDVPGEILISSRETETEFLVIVRDDFEGFDTALPDKEQKASAKDYIRDILEITVGGTLTIRSKPGEGTVSIISIPKKIKKS